MRQWTWGRRWTVRAVSFLLAAFAVLGGLAIQGHQKAAAYQRYLANSRRHAFAELSTGLNELDADLQKGIYATSPAMLTSLCTQIFGKAMSAQMALGELPYGSIELEQTAAFLSLIHISEPTCQDRRLCGGALPVRCSQRRLYGGGA